MTAHVGEVLLPSNSVPLLLGPLLPAPLSCAAAAKGWASLAL
jgi:hypothetical protein